MKAHTWDCMDAHMLPCRCGADAENAVERATLVTRSSGGSDNDERTEDDNQSTTT